MKNGAILALLAGAAATSAQASMLTEGVVSFTYADPSGELSVVHTEGGLGDLGSTITVSTNVDLEIDLTGIGGGVLNFDNVRIEKTVQLGEVTEVAPGMFLADAFNGHFDFFDTNVVAAGLPGELILSGDYGFFGGGEKFGGGPGDSFGAAFILTESGVLTANDSFVGGSLEFSLGTQLANLFAADNLSVGDDRDASWTLTNITPDAAVNQFGFFSSFDADGAFTGSFNVVPSPGSVALAGIGGLMFLRSRKRA